MADVRTRMTNRNSLLRRLPVLATLSLVALSACGSEQPDASDAPITSVAPGDTDAPAQSGDLRAPEPIEVLNGAPGATAAGASEAGDRVAAGASAIEPAGVPDVATDMMIAPTYVADFVVADGLPALPGNTTGYVYDAATPATAEQAAAIAAQFGVAGEPVRVEEWEPGGWQIGPTDGSAPSVFVSLDAQQSWSYSPAWEDQPAMAGCATPASPDGSPPPSTIECPAPEPPVGVPSAEQAEAAARELLAGLGVDASAMTFDTYADEWSAYVNVTEFVSDGASQDGIPTGRYWGFGFGAEGSLQWANGLLAVPQPVGPYTLVDLDTAIARLREQYTGNGVPMPVDMIDPATETATATATGPASGVGDVEVVPNTGVIVVEPPFETYPAPEPVTVTLVDVQADLWWAWAADGSVWMVPAYRFIGDDGGWYTVPAVTDDYLVEITPPTVTAVPLPEPAPAPPTTIAPEGTDEELVALVGLPLAEFTAAAGELGYAVVVVFDETTRTVADTLPSSGPQVGVHTWSVDGIDVVRLIAVVHSGNAPATTVPAVDTIPTDPSDTSALQPLVGLSIEEFGANAEAMGWTVRIVEIDGVSQPVTMDFLPNRVNVAVVTNDDGSQTVKSIVNAG
jgi:hypothetical protein